jgi:hypothetical protein
MGAKALIINSPFEGGKGDVFLKAGGVQPLSPKDQWSKQARGFKIITFKLSDPESVCIFNKESSLAADR